jgi:hypothetical protein
VLEDALLIGVGGERHLPMLALRADTPE